MCVAHIGPRQLLVFLKNSQIFSEIDLLLVYCRRLLRQKILIA